MMIQLRSCAVAVKRGERGRASVRNPPRRETVFWTDQW